MKSLSFLLAAALLLFSGSCRAQSTNAEIAGKFITALSQEHYDEAVKLFDPAVPSVTPEVLAGGWKQITGMFGVYQSYYIPEGVDQNAFSIPAGVRFANSTQGFSCSFNDKHQLTSFVLAPAPAAKQEKKETPASRFRDEAQSIAVTGGTLKGNLMLPEQTATQPAVALILAGSGATDRNGNDGAMLHTNAYTMIAETLAASGIASLRFDKRLIGESNGFDPDESKLRFDAYVDDAVQLIRYLRERGYKKVFIIGHSEGSLIGILAAERVKVDALVSLCGAGENIANVLRRQIANPEANAILDELKSGNMTNNVPSSLQIVFRPSVQPYLLSWMKYEPEAEIARLKIPMLVVGGTTDLQVPVADAERLKKAAPQSELLLIEGMNHVLKQAPADITANKVTYTHDNLPLHPDLAAALVRFLAAK
ncbi:alpha/beta fold hydrolase [Taibaiella koreensis]|uniref:alpha/beta fold hydrolase n=1 Tax=Taibaiella koreensis TaxID=1268548 RepID=UPI0013C33638|nr:alpha/beta fold hydrolase [Taibaiella koreensis]